MTTNVLVPLKRLAEFLDMHIISTNMVSFDRDLNRKGAHTWLMLERMSLSTSIELESASSKRCDMSLVMLKSMSNDDTYSLLISSSF